MHQRRETDLLPGQLAEGSAWSRFKRHIFELATAVAFFLVGLNYLMDSSSGKRSSLARSLAPFDTAWCCLYVLAAPAIIFGILKISQRFRVCGLLLMATGLTMNFIAAVTITPLELRDFTYMAFAIACVIRAFLASETVRPVVTRRARA